MPWKRETTTLRIWNWSLGREEACPNFLADQSPASTSWLLPPHPLSDTEMWEARRCAASEAVLSTQGECSAAWCLPTQAKWLVIPEVVTNCWCGAGERWEHHVCRRTSLREASTTTAAGASGGVEPQSLCCPRVQLCQAGGEGFSQQKENWALTPHLPRCPPGRRVRVRRAARWSTAPQARPGAALHFQQLPRGWGVNLLPRPPCQ